MHAMRDSRLATIVDRFRYYLGDILKSVDDNENYHPFRELMLRFSSYGPEKYQQTYRRFLGLMSDVYDPSLSEYFDMQFQVDMSEPLKNTIEMAGKKHLYDLRRIVGDIMADGLDEHLLANSVAGMLLELDWDNQRDICHIIFNESIKRAFRFPKHFGINLKSVCNVNHALLGFPCVWDINIFEKFGVFFDRFVAHLLSFGQTLNRFLQTFGVILQLLLKDFVKHSS